MNKKNTIIHYVLLSISLAYSFIFYNSITIELAIMAIIFNLLNPNLFMTAKESKGIKRNVFSALVVILVILNLLAISSSFINKYNKNTVSNTINENYINHNKKITELEASIKNINTELSNYPSLDIYISNSPRWENKTQLQEGWQKGKQEITTRLDNMQKEYNKELSKKLNKYNVIEKEAGYNAIFTELSKKLNVKASNLVLLIYFIFALLLETLIFYTKILSVKESKNYVKSSDEMIREAISKMTYQLHKKQLESLEDFNNNMLLATVQKFESDPIEIKKIESNILEQNKEILEPEPREILEQKPKEILEQTKEEKEIQRKIFLNSVLGKKDEQKEDINNSKKVLKVSIKFKNKKFNKKPEKTSGLKVINGINLNKESDVKHTKELIVKDNKKIDKALSAKYKKVKNFLEQNYDKDTCLNSSKIKAKFNLTVNEYRKIMEMLKNENVVYTESKKTYMSSKLKAVK